MKMDMYWSQQEVFLMGILSLFPEEIKDKPITPDGELRYYFNCQTDDELARQLHRYKKSGLIEFEEVPVLVKYLGMESDPNDESNFRPLPSAFVIRCVNTQEATNKLTRYLKNWHNDKLLTSASKKPDDSTHQHEKLLTALARAYERQDMPHINISDIYNDDTGYEPPFWETVLAPQLVSNQYEIRQMNYDMNNRAQPFVDIKITNIKLHRSLELASKSSKPIYDNEPEELEYRGLRVKRDSLVDYNGTTIQLTGQETAALRALMERPDELRPREDITIELSAKNAKPDNLAKLISSLRIKLEGVIGYNCIENKSGQGWILKISSIE